MGNLNNYFNQKGKILCEILKFPYKVLIGYWNQEYQQKLKENKELKKELKSLDSNLEQTKEKKEELAYRALNGIDLVRKMKEKYKNN